MDNAKEYVCPEHESFHFGMDTCACCLGRFERKRLYSRKLKEASRWFDDEILIPAGRHLFCFNCLSDIRRKP